MASAPAAPRSSSAVRSRLKQALTVGFASAASIGIVLVNLVDPTVDARATASGVEFAAAGDRFDGRAVQDLELAGEYTLSVGREDYAVEKKPEPIVEAPAAVAWAPPAVTPDPGSAQGYAAGAVAARGWGSGEFDCLVALWNRESGWRVNAHNSSSGAYGIPQALPGSKMASAGDDWETNAATQIEWGLGYIQGRYSSPCGAWAHSESAGWY
ncbi:lytic transglycosylase domain-containing protein [Agromyces mediolanus]|nr:lytic transglycosylase domain-containing protein [Agromyces mediolanus]